MSIPFIVLAQSKVNRFGVGLLSIIILTAVIGISLPPAHAEVTKVALVTDALFSDQGWGTNAYTAATNLSEKYGFELGTAESVAIPDIESTLRDFAEQDYDLDRKSTRLNSSHT